MTWERLKDALAGMADLRVKEAEPLSRHTSFRLGGPATLWVEPLSVSAMRDLLPLLQEVPWIVLGAGTNVLCADEGFGGVVVHTGALTSCQVLGTTVCAQAGVPLGQVILAAAEQGLSGLEDLWGIPGTVGGAVAGNAGAFGRQACDLLTEVVMVTPSGQLLVEEASALRPTYRHGGLPRDHVVVEARWDLVPGEATVIRERMREVSGLRSATQPSAARSAGCVFRNPPGDAAGRLIERAGLKGTRLGGAVVSTQHANYIVVEGEARASDVMALIQLVRSRVWEAFGVQLDLELVTVGFAT